MFFTYRKGVKKIFQFKTRITFLVRPGTPLKSLPNSVPPVKNAVIGWETFSEIFSIFCLKSRSAFWADFKSMVRFVSVRFMFIFRLSVKRESRRYLKKRGSWLEILQDASKFFFYFPFVIFYSREKQKKSFQRKKAFNFGILCRSDKKKAEPWKHLKINGQVDPNFFASS